MATRTQIKTSQKMLVIIVVLLVGSFVAPPLPATRVDGQTNAAGSFVFERILVRGDELVVYTPAPGQTCAATTTGSWPYGDSVVGRTLARPQVFDGVTYVPSGVWSGTVGGRRLSISCATSDVRITQSFIYTESNLVIVRGALLLLVAVYGYYVAVGLYRGLTGTPITTDAEDGVSGRARRRHAYRKRRRQRRQG